MGGNLFKLGRKPRDEYLEIEADVRRFLDGLIPDGYRIPRYYASKPDFGDLDVVVSNGAVESLGGVDAFVEAVRDGLGATEIQNTGHVWASVYREFQVDYFVRATELLDPTANYLAFNDLGNLVGKMFKRLGCKYGETGLLYVFRRDSQGSYKKELLLSRDWPRILGFLGLDVPHWQRGFASLEEMFTWVVASPWFSVAPYVDRDRSTEKRRNRPTMQRFIAWIEAEKIEQRVEFRRERDAYVPELAAAFPEARLDVALERERRAEADAIALRAKFSGGLVREWTGLDGKELGGFMRRLREAHPHSELQTMSPEEIRALVDGFPREEES